MLSLLNENMKLNHLVHKQQILWWVQPGSSNNSVCQAFIETCLEWKIIPCNAYAIVKREGKMHRSVLCNLINFDIGGNRNT